MAVPCSFKWFRLRNGLTEEINRYRGSSYICDPSDIGAIIQAEVTSNDQEYSGIATLQFGPVKLALDLKKHLMQSLTNGSTIIHVSLCVGHEEKECLLKIFEDTIKICHAYSELCYSFDYSIYEPMIEVFSKDPTKVIITFS